MGRISGAKNHDHDATRSELAAGVAKQLLHAGGRQPSLRALAEGAGVDPGTLRHYFNDREGAVKAAFDHLATLGKTEQERARALVALPATDALQMLLSSVAFAWGGALGSMHAAGFGEGMASPAVGQTYIADILEPTLALVEELLTTFAARGELRVANVRVSGLALMAPLLLALFHQQQLNGTTCRPLDLTQFIEAHLAQFLSGHHPGV